MKINPKDISIIEKLRTGNRHAFEMLYKEHFNMVYYFVLKNNGNKEDAKDIFQETIIILFEKTKHKDFSLSCTVKTFIYSIARNLWLKKLRNKSKQVHIADFEQYIKVDINEHFEEKEEDDDDEKINLIMEKIKLLGEKCKALLTGFYFYKKSMQLLATELDYTNAANAKNQKYKCLKQLQKLVLENE